MNVSNMSHLFYKSPFANNVLSRNKQLPGQGNAPANTLQKISNQMITEQENSNKETDQIKVQALRVDTYAKNVDSSDVERAKVILRLRYHNVRMYDRMVEFREDDLVSFKERLQKLDQEIQSYQDILDGKTTSSDGLTSLDVKGSLNFAMRERESLIAAGLERFNDYGNDFVSGYNELANKYFGQTPLSNSYISNWNIDFSVPDIYAEIDRVLEDTREIRGVTQHGLAQISNMMKAYDMGYTIDLQDEQQSPYNPRFDLDAYNIRQEIERLKNGPLLIATGKLENFIIPLDK